MKAPEPGRRVMMVLDDLQSAPRYELASAFQLRWYQPGDEAVWTSIQTAADEHNAITNRLFSRQFPQGSFDLTRRQCFLIDASGRGVATSTAWHETRSAYAEYGLVHWVAVIPELQGRGLGKMILSITCQRLIELGYTKACLRTSTVRPKAIALYEKFGFQVVEEYIGD